MGWGFDTRRRSEWTDKDQVRLCSGVSTQRTNSTTVINAISQTIYGNEMGANGALRFWLGGRLLNNSGSNKTFRYTITFGGSVFYDDTVDVATNASIRGYAIWGILFNQNSRSANNCMGYIALSQAGGAVTGTGGDMNSLTGILPSTPYYGLARAINTAVNQTLAVDVKMDTTAATVTLAQEFAMLEVIRSY